MIATTAHPRGGRTGRPFTLSSSNESRAALPGLQWLRSTPQEVAAAAAEEEPALVETEQGLVRLRIVIIEIEGLEG